MPFRKRLSIFGAFDVLILGPLFWLIDFTCDKVAPFLVAVFVLTPIILLDVVLWKMATS